MIEFAFKLYFKKIFQIYLNDRIIYESKKNISNICDKTLNFVKDMTFPST